MGATGSHPVYMSRQLKEDEGLLGVQDRATAQHALSGSVLQAKQAQLGEFLLNLISCQLTPTSDA